MKARSLGSLASLLSLAATLGCGPQFDSPTEIKSLRILGVQKDKPYAQPGDTVKLTMLWNDGSVAPVLVPATSDSPDAAPPKPPLKPSAPEPGARRVTINWLGGCLNPPSDSYQGCFKQYAEALALGSMSGDPAAPPGTLTFGTGPTFSVKFPSSNVLRDVPPPEVPYGLAYVLFALCAGELAPGDTEFPLRCQDASGQNLGPDDFVLGYTAIYVFGPKADGTAYVNANPITTSFFFGPGEVKDASCFGDACLGTCSDETCSNRVSPTPDCTKFPTLCIPTCKDDGDMEKCPSHDMRLEIDPTTFEKDEITSVTYGHDYGEQMWIDYYSTRGGFRAATKLLNDASTGYNHVNGTQFYAPSTPGPVEIWTVMHDNRGGVSWAGTTVLVQ